uniref:Mitochondrial translocase OXA1 n=1 Tax=Chlamydomonas reinhardtii TaxID=3055 RepID=B9VPZ6_CHLRE|nr:mitochondrial translocase OXA1 [Chlamydomonas reinhardtii]
MFPQTSQEEHQRLFQAFRNEYNVQTAKHGDPVKTALVVPGVMILNGAIFLSIFNGVSKLMAAKVPSLTTGGALWFSDLTSPDPYFGLPLMCTAVTLAMVEYGINLAGDAGPMPEDRAKMTNGLKNFMRVMAFMFIPAGGYVAAGTAVLWVSNTAFGVVQGLTLRNDRFRRRVGLPTMQALRDMNAKVMAANAAGTPASAGAAGASAAATLAAAADTSAPASAAPLLSNSPVGAKARR